MARKFELTKDDLVFVGLAALALLAETIIRRGLERKNEEMLNMEGQSAHLASAFNDAKYRSKYSSRF